MTAQNATPPTESRNSTEYGLVNASLRSAARMALDAAAATEEAAAAAAAYRAAKARARAFAREAEEAAEAVEAMSKEAANASKATAAAVGETLPGRIGSLAANLSYLQLQPITDSEAVIDVNVTESTRRAKFAADEAVRAARRASRAIMAYKAAEHEAYVAAEAGLQAARVIDANINATVELSREARAALLPPMMAAEHIVADTTTLHPTTTTTEPTTTTRTTTKTAAPSTTTTGLDSEEEAAAARAAATVAARAAVNSADGRDGAGEGGSGGDAQREPPAPEGAELAGFVAVAVLVLGLSVWCFNRRQ